MEIRLTRHGRHVAVVTIDNQPRRNAMTRAMPGDLRRLWDELEGGHDCRCIVLTGAGERAFSAGADISGDLSGREETARAVSRALLKADPLGKPIVSPARARPPRPAPPAPPPPRSPASQAASPAPRPAAPLPPPLDHAPTAGAGYLAAQAGSPWPPSPSRSSRGVVPGVRGELFRPSHADRERYERDDREDEPPTQGVPLGRCERPAPAGQSRGTRRAVDRVYRTGCPEALTRDPPPQPARPE